MYKPWYKTWWGISILGLLTLILILFVASIFYIINEVKELQKNGFSGPINIDQNQQIYQAEGDISNHWIGAKNPAVTIVLFYDYNCPLCKNVNEKIRRLAVENGNKIKIIFRDFPVVGENSVDLAMAGRCAGEQGLFWAMHEKLFANQGISTEEIDVLASSIDINEQQFKQCMTSQKFLSNIQKDYLDAESFEIRGAPTMFINGYKIAGDPPEELIRETINKLISK